jgi:predicted MFS family arabinose efflux permease
MSSDTVAVRWNELITREHLPKLVTMSLALWLHATNSMLVATTVPSAVDEIGGLHLISWAFALYLAGSIVAAASISMIVARLGLRRSLMRAALVYTIGCIVVATAPTMEILLVGRVLQGLGGGALIALVYVSQDRFFPNRLVPKVVALHSMVWMVAAFSGPAIGGAFATLGIWRMAFWSFAIQGLLLVPAIHFLMRGGEREREGAADRIPIFRILFLCAAILLFSLSAARFHPWASPLMIVAGCLSLIFFVKRDRHAELGRILPCQATEPGHPIFYGILMTLILSLSIMSFIVYGPFLLIELYGMTPLEAGFVVLIESLAWGSAAVIMSGVSANREPRVIRIGSSMVVIGLIGMALTLPNFLLWPMIAFVIVLNGGMGMMWGYVIKRIIGGVPATEKDRAASTLPITQQTGFALGAALSGVVANSLGVEGADAATLERIGFWLFAGFVPLALAANWLAAGFVSPRPG